MIAADRPLPVVDPELPWDRARPQLSESSLRRLYQAVEGDAEHSRAVNLLTQIARAEAMQGKLSDAERTLDLATKLLATSLDVEPRLRLLLERGRLLALRRTPVQARECFTEAWDVARAKGFEFHAVDAAHMMALVSTPKERSKWTMQALDLAMSSPHPRVRVWRGDLHIVLGRHYEEQLQLTKAIEHFDRAATCFHEQGAAEEVWVARSHVGRAYRLAKRTTEALALQEAALKELGKNSLHLGMVFEELAECLIALRRPTEAEPYFKRAHEALSKDDSFESSEPARFKRIKTLGKVKDSQRG